MITIIALTIVVIVVSEINHLNHPLWKGQDLPYRKEIIIVVGIKDFSVLQEIDRASRWE
jgi:hypothetical protein